MIILKLDISAISVVIVIIVICDMPRQEFSLCEHAYIHHCVSVCIFTIHRPI